MSIILKIKHEGKPILRGHDHYWRVILQLNREKGYFTLHDIAQASNDPTNKAIADYLKRLCKSNYIKITDTKPLDHAGFENIYCVLINQAQTPCLKRDGSKGQQGLGQQQMWNTLRHLKSFTAKELAVYASTDEVLIKPSTALQYCKKLQNAGYFSIVRKGGASKPRIWRLKPSMNTGPQPPMILRTKVVYDQNKNRLMDDEIHGEASS